MKKVLPTFLNAYFDSFESYIQQQEFIKNPEGLEIPIAYTVQSGGKRIRPLFVLLIADSPEFGYAKALDAALTVELFHNFTLIHDDFMDQSTLRRGQATVFKKWNRNTAILAGDALLVLAYQQLRRYRPKMRVKMYDLLNSVAKTVCDGQYLDIEFESRSEINSNQYLDMITKKTACLFGCSFQFGALVSEDLKNKGHEIFELGLLLGKIFQIQDDYLDIYGDTQNFGKVIGGDIRQRKKTILFTQAMKLGTESQKNELLSLYGTNHQLNEEILVEKVMELFHVTKADTATKALIETDLETFDTQINKIGFSKSQKQKLTELLLWLSKREN